MNHFIKLKCTTFFMEFYVAIWTISSLCSLLLFVPFVSFLCHGTSTATSHPVSSYRISTPCVHKYTSGRIYHLMSLITDCEICFLFMELIKEGISIIGWMCEWLQTDTRTLGNVKINGLFLLYSTTQVRIYWNLFVVERSLVTLERSFHVEENIPANLCIVLCC